MRKLHTLFSRRLFAALVVVLALTAGFFPATRATSGPSDWDGVKLVGVGTGPPQVGLASGGPSGAGCTVGSLTADRVATGSLFEFATGTAYDDARAELANPANFGPGGVVDRTFQLLPAVYDVTGSNLADADIFWAASLLNAAPLSAAEQQALLDFVEAGGALVIIADVGPNFSIGPNSVAAPFGVTWDGTSFINANPTITDPSHAIISGPFGTATAIAHASEGSIEDLGLYALEIASNLNGNSIAYIAPGSLTPGSGPVVFFSDINEFTSNSTPFGGPGFDRKDNRILFGNLFAYLCPTPTPTPTHTPTATPTATPTVTPLPPPPPPIGGIGFFPGVGGDTPLETADASDGNAGLLAGIVAGISAAVVTVTGVAWYARRRWLA